MLNELPRPPQAFMLQAAREANMAAEERDARFTFEAFKAQIEILQAAHQDAAVGLLVPFSEHVVHVREVGFEGRNVIFVKGELNGDRVCLVIHHTQLQILLVPVNPQTGTPVPVLYLVPNED